VFGCHGSISGWAVAVIPLILRICWKFYNQRCPDAFRVPNCYQSLSITYLEDIARRKLSLRCVWVSWQHFCLSCSCNTTSTKNLLEVLQPKMPRCHEGTKSLPVPFNNLFGRYCKKKIVSQMCLGVMAALVADLYYSEYNKLVVVVLKKLEYP
jgi:hypothetical protein